MRGHIEQRGPDRWRIAIDLGRDASGKRKRLSVTVHGAKKEAEAERVRLLHEVTTESYLEPATMLMDEYLRQWLAHARTTVAPQTYRRYAQIVGNELIPAFGRTRLRDLSPLEIQAFLSRSLARNCQGQERQLSAQTVRHFFQVLERALNQAVRWELIVRNPCQLVDPPRVSSRR